MRKYKQDSEYLPYIKKNAGKILSFDMADELDIPITKLRELAMQNEISLRVAKKQPIKGRDKKFFAVKPDPFGSKL